MALGRGACSISEWRMLYNVIFGEGFRSLYNKRERILDEYYMYVIICVFILSICSRKKLDNIRVNKRSGECK